MVDIKHGEPGGICWSICCSMYM